MRARAISVSVSALMIVAAASGQNVAEVARMEHEGGVNGIAFSPDGRKLATGGQDCSVRIWEVPSGRELASLTPDIAVKKGGASKNSYGLAFSPDGRFLATGNFDATIRVWELASGRVVARMATTYGRGAHELQVVPYGFVFSPDGRYLATASRDGVARVWEVATGREVVRMTHEKPVHSVAFSPDGRLLATGSYDPTARVWEVSTGREIAQLKHEQWVGEIAWTPDGRSLVSGSSDGLARVWEAATGRETGRMKHEYGVEEIAISPDGRYLATSMVGSAHIWDLASARGVARMSHKLSLRGDVAPSRIIFSPDGKYLAGSGFSKTVHIWETATGREVARMMHTQEVMANVAFTPDGEYLATAHWRKGKGIVRLWSWQKTGPISAAPAPPLEVSQNAKTVLPTPSSQPTKEPKLPEAPAAPTLKADEFEMSGSRAAILSAKTVKVVGVLGTVVPDRIGDRFDPNPAYAKKQIEKVIRNWGRYRLVEVTSEADLVLVIIEGINERIYRQGPSGRMEVHGRDAQEGEEIERVLVDRLRIFRGGEFIKGSTTPLWDSGELAYGVGDVFRLRTPGTSAAAKFRKFVEELEKERGK